jgi:hypothetical protein
MYKHKETKHEFDEDDLDDRKEMLEEAHAHAVEHGPEHHATILKGMIDECDEYDPTESSEKSDEDEEDLDDIDDEEDDEREKKDDREHYDEEESEGSEAKKSDMDIIGEYAKKKVESKKK